MADIIAALIVVAIALWGGHKTITGARFNTVRPGRGQTGAAHDTQRDTR